MDYIKPKLGAGFRDYLPEDEIPRQQMIKVAKTVFERFGYVPIDTPSMEREEILTGNDPNFKMKIFRAGLEQSNRELALRFDLTVPLARVIATYPTEIKKPFKRYQIGKVWRGEKPQAGRFREFTQFDIDIVGSDKMMADAEIIAIMYETMTALGFDKVLIRVNNRKILNGLSSYAKFPAKKTTEVLRILDKLDKQGWAKVQEELSNPEDFIGLPGVSLSKDQIQAIREFLDLQISGKMEMLEKVRQLMGNSERALEGIKELTEIISHVKALGVPDDKWTIDLSVARGLGYYTGPVFETMLTDALELGSVFSGGRYDDLVSHFSPISVPATGASLGLDRVFAIMEKLKIIKHQKTVSQVMILNFDNTCVKTYEEIATLLRRADISTEIYLGKEVTLKGQLAYAVKQEIPVVIFLGRDEMEKGVVQVKDMQVHEQKEMPQSKVVEEIKKML